jgi:GntR family transcriptional regulator/MocR family aminotransferase
MPDPRGGFALREQIAAMLAITRSTPCTPDQVILTSGYSNGLWLTMLALEATGKQAWYEDPGCPLTREGLRRAGVNLIPVPVDEHGLQVDLGVAIAPGASLAIVSPTAHAPTGATLSQPRRRDLLGWAEREGAWIVENDGLGGLQLARPAAPALAAHDEVGRVILIGAFDQTLSQAVGLGFVVAPKALAPRFAQAAALLNPASNVITQSALADFLSEGHYLRHLRQMRRLYRDRKGALEEALRGKLPLEDAGPLAVAAPLAAGVDDIALARRALDLGITPSPLSIWRHDPATARPGLLLGIANVHAGNLDFACDRLLELVS